MQNTEAYNTLRDLLNKAIPSRLELKFGCDVYCEQAIEDENGNECDLYGTYIRGQGEDTEVMFENAQGELMVLPALVTDNLGTPPTLQETLMVLGDEYCFIQGEICRVADDIGWSETYGVAYDLTKPVSKQSEETLRAIINLLKSK